MVKRKRGKDYEVEEELLTIYKRNVSLKKWKDATTDCNTLGNYFKTKGEYQEAYIWHERELECATKSANGKGVNVDMAVAYRLMGEAIGFEDFDRGVELVNKYFSLSQSLSNKNESIYHKQLALHVLGDIHYKEAESTTDDPMRQRILLKLAREYFGDSLNEIPRDRRTEDENGRLGNVLLNMSLVQFRLEEVQAATKNMKRAISIAKESSDWLQLSRCQFAYAAELLRCNKAEEALEECKEGLKSSANIKDPIDRRNRFYDNHALLVQISVHLLNVDLAHEQLKEIRRKGLDKDWKKEFETLATNVIKLSRYLTEINECTEWKIESRLVEKCADILCDMNLYSRAVFYYKKMLDLCTDNEPDNLKEIKKAEQSIAITLMDMEDYWNSLQHFKESLTLEKILQIPYKDQCETHQMILKCLFMLNSDANLIKEAFNDTIELAERSKDKKLISDTYEFCKKCLEAYFEDDALLRVICDKLANPIEGDDGEDEVSESQGTSLPDSDPEYIDLDKELGLDENDEGAVVGLVEETGPTYSSGRIKRCKRFRKNDVGESPLHLACKTRPDECADDVVKLNLRKVEKLLEEGARPADQDNNEWCPIHEAANARFDEAIKLLLKFKAQVDVRGGDDKITPLMDAASNGHLSTCKLLLSAGADKTAIDKKGWTAWHHYMDKYNRMLAMDDFDDADLVEAAEIFQLLDPGEVLKNRIKLGNTLSQRNTTTSHEKENNNEYTPDIGTAGVEEYVKQINTIRNRRLVKRRRSNSPVFRRETCKTLVDEETDVVQNDWLEDDLQLQPSNPRKPVSEISKRQSGHGVQLTSTPVKSQKRVVIEEEEGGIGEQINNCVTIDDSLMDFETGRTRNPLQLGRTSGFYESSSNRFADFENPDPALVDLTASQPKTKYMGILNEPRRSVPVQSINAPPRPTDLYTRVTVNFPGINPFYKPIHYCDKHKSIGWLRDVICDHMRNKGWVTNLFSNRVQVCSEEDIELENEYVVGDMLPQSNAIIKLKIKDAEWDPVHQYEEICKNMSVPCYDNIRVILEEAKKSHHLDVSQGVLNSKDIVIPFLKSLSGKNKLISLNLSKNRLRSYAEEIGNVLAESTLLQKLNMENTTFNNETMEIVVKKMKESSVQLKKLTDLNLSFNRLDGNGFLKFLTLTPNIRHLHLSGIYLTCKIFEQPTTKEVCNNYLSNVLSLDLSRNIDLSINNMRSVFECLPWTSLKTLNLAGSFGSNINIEQFIANLSNFCAKPKIVLEDLNFCGLYISSIELIDKMASVCNQLHSLRRITLSCTTPSTVIIAKFFKSCQFHPSLKSIHFVDSSPMISDDIAVTMELENCLFGSNSSLIDVKLPVKGGANCALGQSIITAWKNKHGARKCSVKDESLSQVLHLCIH